MLYIFYILCMFMHVCRDLYKYIVIMVKGLHENSWHFMRHRTPEYKYCRYHINTPTTAIFAMVCDDGGDCRRNATVASTIQVSCLIEKYIFIHFRHFIKRNNNYIRRPRRSRGSAPKKLRLGYAFAWFWGLFSSSSSPGRMHLRFFEACSHLVLVVALAV